MTQLSLNLIHHTDENRQFSIEFSRLPAKDSRYAIILKIAMKKLPGIFV